MASKNGIDRRSRLPQLQTFEEVQLRDALGELMVEATGYRDGRCTVQHLNAALERAQDALDLDGERRTARDRVHP